MKPLFIAILLALGACAASANATTLSYTGQFSYDNDVQLIAFSVSAPSTIGLRSWSYAGGVNAAGQALPGGGFDPIVGLFDSAGKLIGQQDDAGCGKVAADAVTQQCWDIDLHLELAAGTYTVSLQQYNNYSVSDNLADGFYYAASQYRDFRNGFTDEMADRRSGAWALDILGADPATPADVPEPASPWLVGVALAGMMGLRSRSRSRNLRAA